MSKDSQAGLARLFKPRASAARLHGSRSPAGGEAAAPRQHGGFRESRDELGRLARWAGEALRAVAAGADPAAALAALEGLEAAARRDEATAEDLRHAARELEGIALKAMPGKTAQTLLDAEALLAFESAIAAAIPKATEEATFAILERIEALHAISSRAAKTSREAKRTFASGESGSSVIEKARLSRDAIAQERSAVAEIASHNRESSKGLKRINDDITAGIALLRNIEEITDRSRLIAFNLAVEAAHFGDKGRGFKIIAGELRSLNDRTEEFSGKVTELLTRLEEESAGLVMKMAEETIKVVSEAEKGMDAAGGAVEALIDSSTAIDGFAREIAGFAEEIDRDMDGVLESLQFQDITRQMLEGVVAATRDLGERLASLRRALGPIAEAPRGMESDRRAAIREELLARAKTKNEKDAIHAEDTRLERESFR
ncbi:MAG: hypothetical protein JNG85_07250 [Spirochaetaceae bacterium]|nr:hypothetical protein [Spirochaetaceae bacterium]